MGLKKSGYRDNKIATEIAPALLSATKTGNHQAGMGQKVPLVVPGPTTMTSMPVKSQESTTPMITYMNETSEQLTLIP